LILEAKNIIKSYGDLKVLKGVDLQIKASEIVSIVGPSGAGKTTLLQILGTLERPDNGSLLIDNISVFDLKDKALSKFRNSNIGFIFQFHQLLPEFTALENTALPALIKGVEKQKAFTDAEKLLERLEVAHRKHHKPNELSGGEQQRVAVCRALINKPAIILADEPSGNLDTKNAQALHNLFFELREEMNQTFIIVTHNNELANMADRKLNMIDGLLANC
jgi:lipoprotein-releasing system ATP-binding protein